MAAKKKAQKAPFEPDPLVPDATVAEELGTTVMTLWRRSNDPDEGFPPPIKIGNRNFRSRRALEAYKARKVREAMRLHKARLALRRRESSTNV
jgi:predicted DNA-binding transcriptional regulator AlpA